MSIRLFHRGARTVVRLPGGERGATWCALHGETVNWDGIFRSALMLVGFQAVAETGGLRFGDGGVVGWTRAPLWTTIRLRLPPCSEKKAALLEAGLLKAARYAETGE
jgi:hypothetical protein